MHLYYCSSKNRCGCDKTNNSDVWWRVTSWHPDQVLACWTATDGAWIESHHRLVILDVEPAVMCRGTSRKIWWNRHIFQRRVFQVSIWCSWNIWSSRPSSTALCMYTVHVCVCVCVCVCVQIYDKRKKCSNSLLLKLKLGEHVNRNCVWQKGEVRQE